MVHISQIFIVGIIFSTAYGIIKLFTHRSERLLMIEKGAGLPNFKDHSMVFSSLKFGILFIGLGLGVLAANIMVATTTLEHEVAYFSMVFLFGGIALIIHHFIERKKEVS